MKKVLLSLCLGLLFVPNANATPSCASSLMPAFTPYQATQLCAKFGSAITQSLIPSTDNTYDLGSASKQWRNGYLGTGLIFGSAASTITGGATSLTLTSAGSTILEAANDVNRLLSFSAASDTALALKFGDGATAGQLLVISGSNNANDGYLALSGGKSYGTSNGGNIEIAGVSHASTGSVTIYPANNASSHIKNVLTNASSQFQVTNGTTAVATITRTGQITSAGTSDLGWSIVAGANTACNTTCTSACVLGFDTATVDTPVACTDATADICLCAGAS